MKSSVRLQRASVIRTQALTWEFGSLLTAPRMKVWSQLGELATSTTLSRSLTTLNRKLDSLFSRVSSPSSLGTAADQVKVPSASQGMLKAKGARFTPASTGTRRVSTTLPSRRISTGIVSLAIRCRRTSPRTREEELR